MGIQLKWAVALCLAVCTAQTGSADDRPVYKNSMAPVSARVGLPLISVPKVPVGRPPFSRDISGYSVATH
jgi:hypothetical protein